ncbi:hypothetical protein [Polynucleobacter necessarius]
MGVAPGLGVLIGLFIGRR